MKLYLYCVLGDTDLLPDGVEGIMGKPLSVIRFGSLCVFTSEFDGETVPITRENVLKHSTVINSVLERTTPLPFRFGTIVDDVRLQSFMDARHEAIEERLNLIQGYLEMSVKILWDPGVEEVEAGHANGGAEKGSGTAFLRNKQREFSVSDLRARRAGELSADLDTQVSLFAREKQVSLRPNEKLVLAASHLVKRGSILAYRGKLAEFGRERPDLRLLVSGPWAPYSFANIALEFKTHFGVI